MTAGPQEIRLCEHILTQYYGHACGEVGSILLSRGRLPFNHLVRMSSLTANSIRAALIVLIQQNCVYHSDTSSLAQTASSTNSVISGDLEYFEAIPKEILSRIRFRKYIQITEELCGFDAKQLIEAVLENGKLRVSQLIPLLSDGIQNLVSDKKMDKMSEHELNSNKIKKNQILRSGILNLLGERYLKPSHPHHSINPVDLELAWEKQMIAELPGVPVAKDLKLIKERVVDRFKLEEEQEFEEMCSFDKRRRKSSGKNDRNTQNKRHKADEITLDDDMFVRVNYERFNMKIRDSIFEQECLRSFNLEAALVIRGMLSIAESKQESSSDLASDPISAQSIVIKLGDQSKKIKGCFPSRCSNGQFNLKLKNTGDLVAEMLAIMSKQDDLGIPSTSAYLTGSLDKALAQLNPIPILSEKKSNVLGGGGGSGGMREFKVEYGKYSVELRKSLVTRIVREKYGPEASRIVRILMNKGRLDEKHLAKHAMMSLKESRELCLKLSAANIIELQEVPKTQDRQPSRTFYLFFIDFKKLVLNLSSQLRKSQTNLIIRTDEELKKSKRSILIEKLNRLDVFKDQESLLNVWEKGELERLKQVLEVLEVAKLRLERDLFILNDLPWLN
ncbi:hypothetical protein BY996DRAFT_4578276 [Phakopsora pachyrhizi]|uniref:DNA-directed RNA polymerase III subunit RPC3 n=1 Tax=Phakopsora pachyrhizi TaxID=170000 RepID=A0AAV0AFI0_PHAPC|nr:hypothetical protein BY996DRAFT_4578276 [Phakopsora pachyrhizi]CAH7666876.1 hypothetical protein PPACK8108_LOCUS1237 [Phakopsora pachyrhizi]